MEAFVLFSTLTVVSLIALVGLLWYDHRQAKRQRDKKEGLTSHLPNNP